MSVSVGPVGGVSESVSKNEKLESEYVYKSQHVLEINQKCQNLSCL